MSNHLLFGRESRVKILKKHLALAGPLSAQDAWKFIYRELLWVDGSTGLAHLYESDKAQPGRPWYDRTVTFTELLCQQFGNLTREQLAREIDQLFRAILHELVESPATTNHSDELNAGAMVMEDGVGDWETGDLNTPSIEDDIPEPYTPDAELVTEFASLLVERGGMLQSQAIPLAKRLVARARFYIHR
ncbi:MAG TPA: hypothetical protein VL334_16975 [Anaerolineae bacterium]|nr:hypothetical protein [Anaerolineae bacterium]